MTITMPKSTGPCILRDDTAVAELVKFYIQNSLITVNEARAILSLPPISNGEVVAGDTKRQTLEVAWAAKPHPGRSDY